MRDLKTPPAAVLRNEHGLGARVIQRTAEQLAARFSPERIASEILSSPQAAELRETLDHARERAAEMLGSLHLPQIPSRADLLAEAKVLFAKTTSMDDIVDRARELLLAAVGERLSGPAEQPA